MKFTTQFNGLADREDFVVAYPTQRMFPRAINCGNSADPREQHRYAGEPALLAGVARQVVEEYHADPDHVHVAGASSGAGVAVILAATYPDVFATATAVAGGEYGLNQVDPDDPGSTPPEYTARQAWSQRRVVPRPRNGARLAGPCRRRTLHRSRQPGRQRHHLGLRPTPPERITGVSP